MAVELDVPLMIHVSAACNPHLHTTASHYLAADTTAFTPAAHVRAAHRLPGTASRSSPTAAARCPYHWGRYRGIAQDRGTTPPEELIAGNVFFDTCVYHQAGIDCLFAVIPADNVLFASEMIGAVRGVDPVTGHHFDDTRRYIESAALPAAGADDDLRDQRLAGLPATRSVPGGISS